jgi:D-glycero-D-manno-heptose 1,7-bisphosphate phosphatase
MKKKTKIAFLDRDGVLNKSEIKNGYVGFVKDFKWINGAKKAIKFLKKKDFKIVIVSNQSGIARGFFSIKDVYKQHRYLKQELNKFGTSVDKIYFCPYHKDGVIKKYKKNSILRKPRIGMFLKASKVWNIDKQISFMIGDQKTDMEFAKSAKIKGYLFRQKNLYKFVEKKIYQMSR